MSLRGKGGEVAVGRRDDSYVHLDRVGSADALELLLLEHAQQLGLQVEAHLAHFVEEQSAEVGSLEGAFDAPDCAGEGAFLVAE